MRWQHRQSNRPIAQIQQQYTLTAKSLLKAIQGGKHYTQSMRQTCLTRSSCSSIISIHAIALAFLLTVGTVLAAFT